MSPRARAREGARDGTAPCRAAPRRAAPSGGALRLAAPVRATPGRTVVAGLALVAVLAGCSPPVGGAVTATSRGSTSEASPSRTPPAASVPVPADAADPTAGLSPEQVAAARPVRLRIPRIGVDTDLVDLGVDAAGALEVPVDFARAGWFTRSALPGAQGPEVIAGHVDDQDGPAVFYRLRDLAAGDEVTVVRGDGAPVAYRVDGVEQHPKDAFPTAAVYGPSPGSVLRLITCGGSFDRASGHYRDNTVVYASLAA